MKNIKYISCLFLSAMILGSCEEKLQVLDSSNYSVRFNSPVIELLEGNSLLKIPVTLTAPAQGTAVSVQYEVTGNAVVGTDYSFATTSGSITIAAGSYSDTVKINILDDLATDGAKELILTLKSVSNGLKPGIGTLGKSTSIKIADNDCPFTLADYVGSYNLTMKLDFGFIFAAGTYTDLDASLTQGAGANQLVDPDFGILSQSGRTPVPVTIQILPDTQSTRTLGSSYNFGDGTSVTDAVYAYGTAPNQRVFTGDGAGSLSACVKSFTVKALIRRQDGSIGQRLTLTYTKL